MKTSADDAKAEPLADGAPARASLPADHGSLADVDIGLLEDSLAKTPWERMQANDDALRFAESLRAAMEKRNAESQRINTPPR